VQTRPRSTQGNPQFDRAEQSFSSVLAILLAQRRLIYLANLPAEQLSQFVWCIIPHSKLLNHLANLSAGWQPACGLRL
jgi:hypothetical protein